MFADPSPGPSRPRYFFIVRVTLAVRGDMTVYGTSGILPLRQTIDYLHTSLMLVTLAVYSELAARGCGLTRWADWCCGFIPGQNVGSTIVFLQTGVACMSRWAGCCWGMLLSRPV